MDVIQVQPLELSELEGVAWGLLRPRSGNA
jgi:hypothetical protein